MIQAIDYAAIAPPLILALGAGLVLVVDLFVRQRVVLDALSLLTVVVGLVAVAVQGRASTFCLVDELRGQGPAACSYVADDFTRVFAAVMLGAAVIVVLLSTALLRSGQEDVDRPPAGEWHFLLLCALAGAVTLPASRDLIMLVVSLELVSLPVFALTAMKRRDGRAGEAALKLFLVSVVSTAIMLFGASLIYGLTGQVHLERIAAALVDSPAVTAGVVLVLAGFAFKVAAVPFHFWAPDVYQGAPLPVAALLSVVSKAAGFAGLILMLMVGFPALAKTWSPLIAVLAALTMSIGNLMALRQRNAVRLLAWSSVAQSGYMLTPLAVASTRPSEAVAATIAYLVFYAVMNIGAFAVVALVSGGRDLEDYRGLAFSHPASALALAFFLVCLAGLPPGLAGLFAKIVVFREVVAGGVAWLAIVMAINTVIGLYYYIAWGARLFAPPGVSRTPSVSAPIGVAIAVAAVVAVVLSAAPQLVLQVTPLAASALG